MAKRVPHDRALLEMKLDIRRHKMDQAARALPIMQVMDEDIEFEKRMRSAYRFSGYVGIRFDQLWKEAIEEMRMEGLR